MQLFFLPQHWRHAFGVFLVNIDIVMRQQKFDHLRIPKGTCNMQWKAVASLRKKQLICGKELSWAYNSLNTDSDGNEQH